MSFTLFSNQLYLPAITTFTFILILLITSRIVFILIIIIIIIVIIMIIIITIMIIIINTPFSLSKLSLKSWFRVLSFYVRKAQLALISYNFL